MSDSMAVAGRRAITVPFHGANLYVVEHNGQPYTPMKPIVDGMGLDWKSQHRKVAANQGRWGMAIITMPMQGGVSDSETPGDLHGRLDHAGQRRAVTCIPVRKVAAWLATVEPGKVKNPGVRARVVMFQNECDDVLWQYWNDGQVLNPRAEAAAPAIDYERISPAQKQDLKEIVDFCVKSGVFKSHGEGWARLHNKFRVNSYHELPAARHWDARQYLIGKLPKGYSDHVVDDEPAKPSDAERIQLAFALAANAASEVQRTVFDAVMGGDPAWWRHSRYLLALNYERGGEGPTRPWAKALSVDEMTVSMDELPERLTGADPIPATDVQLARLASACAQKLAGRAKQREAQKAPAGGAALFTQSRPGVLTRALA